VALPTKSLGLCATCNSREICIARHGFIGPVLQCEEFDDSMYGDTQMQGIIAGRKTNENKVENSEPDISMGLCCTCENRSFCILSKQPGGVWHCEEYK